MRHASHRMKIKQEWQEIHHSYNHAELYLLFIIIDMRNTYIDLTYKIIYPYLGTYIAVIHVVVTLLL